MPLLGLAGRSVIQTQTLAGGAGDRTDSGSGSEDLVPAEPGADLAPATTVAGADIDEIVEQVLVRLTQRIAGERERRGY
jgi:hypothetical protein